jgi:heme exporter protein D
MALRRVLSVPKEAILRDEAEERKRREKKRAAKKPN